MRTQIRKEDSSLHTHIQIITGQNLSVPKLQYSLACISNTLAYTNSNRYNNIQYLLVHIKLFIQILESNPNYQSQQQCVVIINVLLSSSNQLTLQDQYRIMNALSYTKGSQTNNFCISDRLAEEILKLTYRIKFQKQNSGFISKLMSQKMIVSQVQKFIQELKKQQLKNISIQELIKIGNKFKNSQKVLSKILKLLYWKISNNRTQNQQKQIGTFLSKIIEENVSDQILIYECLLLLKSSSKKVIIDINMQLYANSLLKVKKQLYLPLKNQFIRSPLQLIAILQYGKQFEIYHFIIMDYLVKNNFGYREDWKNALKQNNNQKNIKCKQIMLRICGVDFIQSQNGKRKSKCPITLKQQLDYLEILPIQSLRCLQAIVSKLTLQPSIQNCLHIIQNISYYPKQPELLLSLHKICLKHKQYPILSQIQKIIMEEYNEQFVFKKLKQKESWKQKNKNKGKLYFIWVPLLIKNKDLISKIEDELNQVINYEIVAIQEKFYVLQYMLQNKLKKPLHKFLHFILRLIQNGFEISVYKEINYYIKRSNLKQSTEVVSFLRKNFQFQLQRVLQILFSKTVTTRSQDLREIIFQLQKWQVYDTQWSNIYRWIITALQEVSDWDHLYTLDCLQIFQMIIQKIKPNDIPAFAKQRFFKSVFKNWIKYQNDHLFAIQRIYQILYPNKQEDFGQLQVRLPSIQQLMLDQSNFIKNHQFFFQGEHPTSIFLIQLTQLQFFDKISQSQAINLIIELYDKKYSEIKRFTQHNVILILNFLLWTYQYSQQEMSPKMNEMLLTFMVYKGQGTNEINSYTIRQKCIQIISVVTHSINLLKLPIKQLLQTYILQADVIRNINQILSIIIQSKPKAIQAFNLEGTIQSIFLSLIIIEDLNLAQEYVHLIQTICYVQNSKYSNLLQDSIQTIYQIIKSEIKTVSTYRKQLVLFVLQTLNHYQFIIQERIMWFLINKYFIEEEIIQILLKSISLLYQKQTKKLYISNEQLLIRILLHHNDKSQILKLCQQILKKAQKQNYLIKIKVSEEVKTTVASDSILQVQHLFNQYFQKQNYDQCLKSISKIRDPYKIKLQTPQISKFFANKNIFSYTKLIDYLLQNPSTRKQILSDVNFYLSSASITQILTLRKLFLSFHDLSKIKIISLDKDKLYFKREKNQIEEIIAQAFHKVFSVKQCKIKIVQMGKQLNTQEKYQLIGFFSIFCRSKQGKIIINQVLNEWSLLPDWEYMKLSIPYQISNLSVAPIDYMLRHLQVHLSNIQFKNTPQEASLQSYLSQLISRIISSGSLKQQHHLIYQTFLYQEKKKVTSRVISQNIKKLFQKIFTQIVQKSINLIDQEIYGILSIFMFLLKCNINYKNGILGKILIQIDLKIKNQPFMRQAYNFIVQRSEFKQESLVTHKIQNQYKPKIKQQAIKQSQIPKNQTKKVQNKNISTVIQAQTKVQEQGEVEEDKQISQAYSKCKKIQPQVKIITQAKPKQTLQKKQVKKQKEKSLTQVQIKKNKQVIEPDFGQDLIKPKQDNFNQNNYYIRNKIQDKSGSKSQRQAILKGLKQNQKAEISITTLKQHIKFITLLNSCATLSLQQILQLLKSIDSITQTVLSHHYYVKKVVDLEATYKLIQLYKKSEIIIQDSLKQYRQIFQSKLLNLHHAMSFKKQKKTILFNDDISIDFFKLILKKSLKQKQNCNQNKMTLQIVTYCIKSIDNFFRQGLISMFIQLLKVNINLTDILSFFNKIDLSRHIIFQMYQRGMLNKMMDQFNATRPTNTTINTELNLWVRLAAKICINKSIQEKYVQFNLHQILWKKQNQIPDLQGRKNIAFFYAKLCHKNQIIGQFLIENQILQSLLGSLQHDESEDLYMLFFNFCQQNKQNLEFVLRIKYHLHLIEKLNNIQKAKSKYFFKSLGQVMTNQYYQPIFFKQQVVQKLTQSYEFKPQSSIYECLLDFICTLKSDKEFQQLKKQKFWNCLSLFEYKLSSQATYAYILQIFLVMIGKGRIKEFNQPQLRAKVALKAEYSINLDGKQLAVKFIVALSAKTKQNYLTERCVRLMASIVGLKATMEELDLIQDMLIIQGTIENIQFLGYFDEYQITSLLCSKFNQYNQEEILIALRIFNYLSIQTNNNKIITEKLLSQVIEYLQKTQNVAYLIRYWSIKLILTSATFRSNAEYIKHIETGQFLLREFQRCMKYPEKETQNLFSQYIYLVQTYQKNNLIPVFELEKIMNKLFENGFNKTHPKLQKLKQDLKGNKDSQTLSNITSLQNGIKVKMYKQDGSSSQLVFYLTEDKLELNCAIQKHQPVKQKWRMPLNQIDKFIVYEENAEFQKSSFYKSSGFFTSAPEKSNCLTIRSKSNQFNILFESEELVKQWMQYIKFAKANAIQILNKVK